MGRSREPLFLQLLLTRYLFPLLPCGRVTCALILDDSQHLETDFRQSFLSGIQDKTRISAPNITLSPFFFPFPIFIVLGKLEAVYLIAFFISQAL